MKYNINYTLKGSGDPAGIPTGDPVNMFQTNE